MYLIYSLVLHDIKQSIRTSAYMRRHSTDIGTYTYTTTLILVCMFIWKYHFINICIYMIETRCTAHRIQHSKGVTQYNRYYDRLNHNTVREDWKIVKINGHRASVRLEWDSNHGPRYSFLSAAISTCDNVVRENENVLLSRWNLRFGEKITDKINLTMINRNPSASEHNKLITLELYVDELLAHTSGPSICGCLVVLLTRVLW